MQHKAEERRSVVASRQRSSSRSAAVSPSPRLSLPFAVFEHVLFDYQLRGRLKLLEEFRAIFASFDKERVGVVNYVRAAFAAELEGWGDVSCKREQTDTLGDLAANVGGVREHRAADSSNEGATTAIHVRGW